MKKMLKTAAILLALCMTSAMLYAQPKNFVQIPGGTFQMGNPNGEKDEQPVHNVTIGAFSISATEVTQAQYKAVMGNNPSKLVGDNYPVNTVTWFDALEYCNELSRQEKLTPCYTKDGDSWIWNRGANGYRLPTEAEWEYAARGGQKGPGTTYSGGNNIDEVGWCKTNSDGRLHEVAKKKPNQFGLYDMSGNVCEWCWDWWGSKTYSSAAQNNPTGISYKGTKRIYRGGDCTDPAEKCNVGYRNCYTPTKSADTIGFRVVKSEPAKTVSSPEYVLIKGGTFKMGDEKGDADAKPVHNVSVSSFYIGATEVTQALYKSVMGKNPSFHKYVDDLPVESVSWFDAVEFCNALSKKDGLTPCYKGDKNSGYTCDFNANGWRLPTEAEWEYAAGGADKFVYSGSNNDVDVAWQNENSDCARSVATLKPNQFGLYDMSGNVNEWCWDWWGSKSYENSESTDPRGLPSGKSRIWRGGGWASNNADMGSVKIRERNADNPAENPANYGFRIVRNAAQKNEPQQPKVAPPKKELPKAEPQQPKKETPKVEPQSPKKETPKAKPALKDKK